MGQFDGILICTDLDGTLLRNDQSISLENREAIAYFKAEGGVFTFITGRMPFFVQDIYDAVRPNGPFGCVNGGGIYDGSADAYLWTLPIDSAVLDLVDLAYRELPNIGIQIQTFDKVYFARENDAMAVFRRAIGLPNLTCDHRSFTGPIAKIVMGDLNPEGIRQLQALLQADPRSQAFHLLHSEPTLLEIVPKTSGKGNLLPRLAECVGVEMKKVIAVGDYNNDLGMLKVAGLGIAVANATPEAKAAADHITVSNEDHAVARIIRDLEEGRFAGF